MATDWGDRPIRWMWLERAFKCELVEEETGEHRRFVCCGRRLITGPRADFPVQLTCFFSFFITLVCWTVLSWALMARANVVLTLTPYLAWVLGLISYLHAGFSDPGVIPLNKVQRLPPRASPTEPLSAIESNPLYCRTCRFVRELGVHHCSSCEVCVMELDHHCGVVGNCIGARNKASFLAVMIFTQSAITFGILNVIFGAVHLAKNTELSLDSNTAFQVMSYLVGVLELIFLVASAIFCLGFNYGLADEMPFSLVTRSMRTAFDRRFFAGTFKRETVHGCGVFQHSKCSRVASMLDDSRSQHAALSRDTEEGENARKPSEERPLTEV